MTYLIAKAVATLVTTNDTYGICSSSQLRLLIEVSFADEADCPNSFSIWEQIVQGGASTTSYTGGSVAVSRYPTKILGKSQQNSKARLRH